MDAAKLRFALQWSGLSQAGLARAAGIQPQRITDHLSGRRRLRAQQLRAIEKALGVQAGWLDTAAPAARQQPRSGHPVAQSMRPLHASLMLVTWGEMLVLWRALQQHAKSNEGGLESTLAQELLRRAAESCGMDEAAMVSAAQLIEQVARLG